MDNRLEQTLAATAFSLDNKEKAMIPKSLKRILVAVAAMAGVITLTAGQASAALNHSEPTLRRTP